MSKDPAFLFYPNDYIGGTMGMTFEEKGAYMDLLMTQFNRGHLTSQMIGQVVGQLWDRIQDKFIQDEQGLWFNKRLDIEKEKRQNFVKTRYNNLLGENQHTKTKGQEGGHTGNRMENENKNVNEKGIKIKKPLWAENFKNYHPEIIYPFELAEFAETWDLWIAFRREKGISAYKKIGEQSALKRLSELSGNDLSIAKLIIEQSIANNYQGLFELKANGSRGKTAKIRQGVNNISRLIEQAQREEAARADNG